MEFDLASILARCDEFGECMRWTGPKANGSPLIRKDGKYAMARRVVHELTTGKPIRRGHHAVMRCRDPNCLVFEHMTLLTTKQISDLAAKEGRFSTPTRRAAITAGVRKRAAAKLNLQIAREIFNSCESGPVLAARHNVHRSMITRIKRGKAWAQGVANSSVFNQAA